MNLVAPLESKYDSGGLGSVLTRIPYTFVDSLTGAFQTKISECLLTVILVIFMQSEKERLLFAQLLAKDVSLVDINS